MRKAANLLRGIGLGAAAMYMADPAMGRRRRSMVRNKGVHAWRKTGDAVNTVARDISNRTQGVVAETKCLFTRGEVDDDILRERVRSRIGRYVSHPGAIEVSVNQGRVSLSGPVLEREVGDLLSSVSSVRGVQQVENRLQIHEHAGDVPGLQGPGKRPGERLPFMQENWSPTTRLLMSAAGGALAVSGFARRGVSGIAAGIVGVGMMARGISNREMKSLVGFGAGRNAVTVQKTINLNAPVERVFEFWDNYQNFPNFMSNVREVRSAGDGRSHWTVSGPGGAPIAWDAVITKRVPNEVLAWKTVKGSAIQHSGIAQFWPNAEGGTTVNIRMSYNAGGALGHALATLVGSDPKTRFDQDLVRMKTLVETGQVPAH